jgi:hypothetical protein
MTGNIAAVRQALDHLDIDDKPRHAEAEEPGFLLVFPVLKAGMDHLIGDFVVSPALRGRGDRGPEAPATPMMCRSRHAAPAPAITARPCRWPVAASCT